MQQTIHKINQLLAELKALPAITKENQQKLDKKFRLEFSYNSNHIRGQYTHLWRNSNAAFFR